MMVACLPKHSQKHARSIKTHKKNDALTGTNSGLSVKTVWKPCITSETQKHARTYNN